MLRYNGNIAEIDWNIAQEDVLKRYTYQYDSLNRLLKGSYAEPNATVPHNNFYNEELSYDVNGNILNLKRNRYGANFGVELIDDLSYSYTGNTLNSITDISNNYFGYPADSGNIITYDYNGNMIKQEDQGLLQINYNHLNLPNYVRFNQFVIRNNPAYDTEETVFRNLTMLYRADGVKQKKIHHYFAGRTRHDVTHTTEYLDGFQYSTVENDFGTIHNNGLQFVPTAEGYFDFVQNKYIYQYKDQVGNVRLSFYNNGSGTAMIDRTGDFYPFGMAFGGESTISTFGSLSPNYLYAFQGQERQQETGWDSFKWRNYDPSMGRFFNIDPLAEKYNTWTPYSFSGNRVIDARELEGLEPVEIKKTTKNLVIVNQGWVRQSPPNGGTQAQNFGKINKDGGIDYSGIGVINNLNSATTQVGVFASSQTENTKNDILSTINSFREQSPHGKLIMVGHSLGADNLVELVNERTNIKVDLLFTLDIADTWDDDNIPSNVKTAVNYYNKRDGFMGSSIGGEDIEAKDPSKTKILNIPVNASHTEIDNKYKFNAYNAVVKELNKQEK